MSNRQQRRHPERVPAELVKVDLRKILPRLVRGVTLAEREGVFAHGFKCEVCGLEFAVFSWLENDAGVGVTFCPECGERTPMQHWRSTHSESAEFLQESSTEIYALMRVAGNMRPMLDDSVPVHTCTLRSDRQRP